MSDTDPIIPDDDDATVRRKVLAKLDGDSHAKMAHTLENPKYVAAVRAAANIRAETEPHRRLVPTEIIQVIEDLRQRDPKSRERGEAVWRDPAAVSELARALANQKARMLAQVAESGEAGDPDATQSAASARPRALRRVAAAGLLVVALAGIVFLVLGNTMEESAPHDVATVAASASPPSATTSEPAPNATVIVAAASATAAPASLPPKAPSALASAAVAAASAPPVATAQTRPAATPTGSAPRSEPLISNVPF